METREGQEEEAIKGEGPMVAPCPGMQLIDGEEASWAEVLHHFCRNNINREGSGRYSSALPFISVVCVTCVDLCAGSGGFSSVSPPRLACIGWVPAEALSVLPHV